MVETIVHTTVYMLLLLGNSMYVCVFVWMCMQGHRVHVPPPGFRWDKFISRILEGFHHSSSYKGKSSKMSFKAI